MTTQIETPARSIKIIGVGSAGKNILSALAERALPGAQFAIVNTDAFAGAEFFPVDAKSLRDVNVADADACGALLAAQSENLKSWCAGADVVFVVTGLGGKTGSALSPVVARMAKESGALVLGFGSLPFKCEGDRRAKSAAHGLEQLKAASDGVVCLPNEKIMQLVGEDVGLREVFAISDGLLADGICGVWQLVNYRGLIEIQFDDLREMLRANRTESFFATAEASGANRAHEAVEKLLANPLLDGGRALTAAGNVVVSLIAGPGLTMAEVNRVMEQINHRCDGAQVLMGAAVDESFGEKLCVTVIATRRERIADEPVTPAEMGLSSQLLSAEESLRPASRFVPPPPEMSAEKMAELAEKPAGSRTRKKSAKAKQGELGLELISKGRFDKSEPTIRNGEDLDQPTYIRRGLLLN